MSFAHTFTHYNLTKFVKDPSFCP